MEIEKRLLFLTRLSPIGLAETSTSLRCLRRLSAEWNVMTRSARMRRSNEALCCHAWRIDLRFEEARVSHNYRQNITVLKLFQDCAEKILETTGDSNR